MHNYSELTFVTIEWPNRKAQVEKNTAGGITQAHENWVEKYTAVV